MSTTGNSPYWWQRLIPRYGNWGGVGWSGGVWNNDPALTDWDVDPVDAMDDLFKWHDQAYQTGMNLDTADAVLVAALGVVRVDGLRARLYRIGARVVFTVWPYIRTLMLYLKWLCFALSEKAMDLLNYFTAPIVVLFADENGWLPEWLSWWQTPDNSLDGDEPWRSGRRPFAKNTGWRRYVNRIAWLYRNSMYGYANSVVGVEKSPGCILRKNFDWPDSGKPSGYDDAGGPALRWTLYKGGRKSAFQVFWVKRWGRRRCIRVNIGWKLWDWDNPIWSSCNCVLSINPWKKVEEQK